MTPVKSAGHHGGHDVTYPSDKLMNSERPAGERPVLGTAEPIRCVTLPCRPSLGVKSHYDPESEPDKTVCNVCGPQRIFTHAVGSELYNSPSTVRYSYRRKAIQ